MYFPYHLRYYDDPTCRSHRKLLGLKAPVPDVLGDILLDNSNIAYRVNIEVHMGTMPLIRVIDKAIKQEWQTIYLCNTNNNMNTLRNAMQDYPQLKGMVYFAIISDFCMKPGGLFGSNYMSLEREVSLYP
jgi:hypothetical protein